MQGVARRKRYGAVSYTHLDVYKRQREGMAMGTLFSVRWAGLDESGNPQAYKKDGTIVKSLADLTVEDLVRSGTSIPPYSASMSNMLTYKGFDLSFMFLYYGGHVIDVYKRQGMCCSRSGAGSFCKIMGKQTEF